ncbi:15400_t:CDS:1, partial [Cetraspora pellucida]
RKKYLLFATTNHFYLKKKEGKIYAKMPIKNLGPCSIISCTNTNVQFRTITVLAYEKCQRKQTLEAYLYLE